jgi:hypothetical protein
VDSLGQRLILLGLVTEDMIFVSQIQQKATGTTIGDLLVQHGWVEPEIQVALG